jgi:2-oxoglutarate dehydrogenase complex dehydrogenase (E1) component-like enzyme
MSSFQDNIIFKKTSFLAGNNSTFIEEFYSDYLTDPSKLPEGWKEFFDGLKENREVISKTLKGPSWAPKKNIKRNNFDF